MDILNPEETIIHSGRTWILESKACREAAGIWVLTFVCRKSNNGSREEKRTTRIFAAVLKSANNRMASSLTFLANRFTDLELES
jgi:hypothetical protein